MDIKLSKGINNFLFIIQAVDDCSDIIAKHGLIKTLLLCDNIDNKQAIKKQIVIGRKKTDDIMLSDLSISSSHLTLKIELVCKKILTSNQHTFDKDSEFIFSCYITDNSTNGTWINETRILPRTEHHIIPQILEIDQQNKCIKYTIIDMDAKRNPIISMSRNDNKVQIFAFVTMLIPIVETIKMNNYIIDILQHLPYTASENSIYGINNNKSYSNDINVTNNESILVALNLEKKIAELNLVLKSKDMTIENLHQQIKILESTINKTNSDYAAIRKEKSIIENKIYDLEFQNKELTLRQNTLEKINDQLINNIRNIEINYTTVNENYIKLKSRYNDAKKVTTDMINNLMYSFQQYHKNNITLLDIESSNESNYHTYTNSPLKRNTICNENNSQDIQAQINKKCKVQSDTYSDVQDPINLLGDLSDTGF